MSDKPKLQAVPDPEAEPSDPFDLAKLRLDPSANDLVSVQKVLTTVPVRKPRAKAYFRVHPREDYRENFQMIEEDDVHFIVSNHILPDLIGEYVHKTLFTTVDRNGVVSLWPVRLPFPEEKQNDWWRSAREAAEKGMKVWIRIDSNKNLGAYEIREATSPTLGEPVWPNLSYQELIRLAFRDHLIDSLDHPVIKRLRGLA
jgi:hypothetical protein